jgi:hypothetical protein
MKLYPFAMVTTTVLIIAACHSSKKSTSSTASTETKAAETSSPTSTVAAVIPVTPNKTANGVYEPGMAELVAIQERYKDVTMSHIQEGYFLYAKGACIKCHGTENVYKYDAIRWAGIIDNMAIKAGISTEQKKSVYFYVMSIQAAKDKEGK